MSKTRLDQTSETQDDLYENTWTTLCEDPHVMSFLKTFLIRLLPRKVLKNISKYPDPNLIVITHG